MDNPSEYEAFEKLPANKTLTKPKSGYIPQTTHEYIPQNAPQYPNANSEADKFIIKIRDKHLQWNPHFPLG